MGIQIPITYWISLVILSKLVFLASASAFASASPAEQTKFTYPSFPKENSNFLKFEGNSSIYNEALQLTPESLNEAFYQTHINKSGRIFYPQPFRLWSSSSASILASFNTNFVINIYRKSEWEAGHGLTFLIAPNSSIPLHSHGQWLGLTNSSTDSNPENHFVAIEFDTQKQDDVDDLDGDHIGIDINSIRSEKTVSLDKYNLTLSPPPPGANYSIWVDYNGTNKIMQVYIAKEGNSKPEEPALSHNIDLKQHLKQDSYFGFSASTGDPQIELNCVLKWDFQIDKIPEDEDEKSWWKIVVGAGVPAGTVAIIIAVYGFVRKRRQSSSSSASSRSGAAGGAEEFGKLKWLPGMPREFKYKELKKATNNFHESMKLGEGGFGIVYKGVLHENSSEEIAVKKFSRDSIKGKDDFLAELTIIHRLRHKNLVRLVGWCYEKGKLLLVYDFMPNGSLEKHLYDASPPETLNWSRRLKVLEGTASALHYLHNEYDQKVIHRDLKASNILLDKDFNARLGDFGLARALENERNSYAELGLGGVAGTMGYVAPECFHTGRATPESDVFGFGAVVLEVVCGKGPGTKIHHNQHLYSLVDWVWMLHREGRIQEAVDERLKNEFVESEAKSLLLLGLACSHPIDSERPKTQAIVQIICGALPAPHVPPFKPAFIWPSMNDTGNFDSSLSGISLSSQSSGRSKSLTMLQRTSSNLPV